MLHLDLASFGHYLEDIPQSHSGAKNFEKNSKQVPANQTIVPYSGIFLDNKTFFSRPGSPSPRVMSSTPKIQGTI